MALGRLAHTNRACIPALIRKEAEESAVASYARVWCVSGLSKTICGGPLYIYFRVDSLA